MRNEIIIILALCMFLASCQKSKDMDCLDSTDNFKGTIENVNCETKTSLYDYSYMTWSKGDQIAIFKNGSSGADRYHVTDNSAGKSNGEFFIVEENEGMGGNSDVNVALYPYHEGLSCEALKFATPDPEAMNNLYLINNVNLPAIQTYEQDSFGGGTFLMVAVTERSVDRNLDFMNVLGCINLQLKGTQVIKSIKIEGNDNEKLSGTAMVKAYSNGFPPVINMDDNAQTDVTLECGDGVQLDETISTNFIITLPPVFFSKGFNIIITDSEGRLYNVRTSIANTVVRSSILMMPPVRLNELTGEPEYEEDEGGLVIPMESILINGGVQISMYPTQTRMLSISYKPSDATDVNITWSSDAPEIAAVDQSGKVTAISDGLATITVTSGTVKATIKVEVIKLGIASNDYIDEYGVNHGKGVSLGQYVWAPVNCGYHAEDFPYGKLYQWGRKYGQGLGSPYDKGEIILAESGVSLVGGQHLNNEEKFYVGSFDWLSEHKDDLWNIGTESSPEKSIYDPCPEGWRVPTDKEMRELQINHSDILTAANGCKGKRFSGRLEYKEDGYSVFLPATGFRTSRDGLFVFIHDVFGKGGTLEFFGEAGYYWSSTPHKYDAACSLFFGTIDEILSTKNDRGHGYPVRCVQD